ncbi:MAG TPA: hypothetical protein VGB75_09155 [Jatrophihabitans sp.]|jgi:hypothetical protein|uniref:hypothetical protein n=1 Tax=Jatrophihabitans sp. TaxID=1932789 RepID=UPI002EF76284
MTASKPVTLRWWALAAAAALGLIGFSLASANGVRAGLSFVGGLALVTACFEFGAFNIRFVGRHLPGMTLLVAMLSYLTTAIALALVLAASSPRVVDGQAIAVGLFAGLAIWLGGELAATWVVREHP